MVFMLKRLNKDKKICIVGAGLVGTLLSIFLSKSGFNVDVYEKRADPRTDIINRGRSIALSLSERGWNALRQVGLEEIIRPNTKATPGRVVHRVDGSEHYQEYGDGSQAINTINRSYLNSILIEEAIKTNRVNFFYQHTFTEMNEESGEITFGDSLEHRVVKKYDHVFAVDGCFSAVRRSLEKKKIWSFEEHTFDFGFKELSFVVNTENNKKIPCGSVHVWPRKNSVLVTLPTFDDKFISTLFFPTTGEDSFETLNDSKKFKDFFVRECSDAVQSMPNIEDDFNNNPASNLTQIKGGPWNYKDKVLLLGDAAHATTPFYAMGMNTGFEDCSVFISLLKTNDFDFSKTFTQFAETRKPDADAMTQLSYENFKSLKESPDCNYEIKWILERKIWKLMPNLWTPTYVLITATNRPLREIPAIKKRQNSILDKLVGENPGILDVSDMELVSLTLSVMQSFDSNILHVNPN